MLRRAGMASPYTAQDKFERFSLTRSPGVRTNTKRDGSEIAIRTVPYLYKLRNIINEPNWQKQRQLWRDLLDSYNNIGMPFGHGALLQFHKL